MQRPNCLYLFYNWYVPKFFVWIGEGEPPLSPFPHLIVWDFRALESFLKTPEGYDWLHAWLHVHLDNSPCPGMTADGTWKRTGTTRRLGKDSWFSNIVRTIIGCFHTNLMDIDEWRIDIDGSWTIFEHKYAGDTASPAQRKVLDNLENMGVKIEKVGWV